MDEMGRVFGEHDEDVEKSTRAAGGVVLFLLTLLGGVLGCGVVAVVMWVMWVLR